MLHTIDNLERKRLLVFNCHEAWVYQLGCLGFDLDIIVGLEGRYKSEWDDQIRPVPANSRFISLSEAQNSNKEYHCIIAHNPMDLLDTKYRCEPKIMVIHLPIEARIIEERSNMVPEHMIDMTHRYTELIGTHVVAVSEFKGRSWGFTEDVIVFGSDVNDYPAYRGDTAKGLRISNFINGRHQFLLWDFYRKAFADIDVRIAGHNRDVPGVKASRKWDDLKSMLCSHRFYIHTANPSLEDGYNMATIEAMSAGMPVLGNNHPASPVVHGVSGFLSNDPTELNKYAKLLLADRGLATKMGAEAKKTVIERFSIERFKDCFLRSIATARMKRARILQTKSKVPNIRIESYAPQQHADQKHASLKKV